MVRPQIVNLSSFFYMDLMHMGDCKGFLALAFGSMLSMLMEDPRLGRVKG